MLAANELERGSRLDNQTLFRVQGIECACIQGGSGHVRHRVAFVVQTTGNRPARRVASGCPIGEDVDAVVIRGSIGVEGVTVGQSGVNFLVGKLLVIVGGAKDQIVLEPSSLSVHLGSELIIRSALQVITHGIDGLKQSAAAAHRGRAQGFLKSAIQIQPWTRFYRNVHRWLYPTAVLVGGGTCVLHTDVPRRAAKVAVSAGCAQGRSRRKRKVLLN